MNIKTYIVDAFTSQTFRGNPAGVCMLKQELTVEQMQSIAAEINLSETAFVLKDARSEDVYHIRYFTPSVEIAFCGHATVASAKVLNTYYGESDFRFLTYHGLSLPALCNRDSIKLNFPLYHPEQAALPPQIQKGLNITEYVYCGYSKDLNMLLLVLASENAVKSIVPNQSELTKNDTGINGVIVTAEAETKVFDFCSRMFAPWVGIPEDPVTGSAHSLLSGYWGEKTGKKTMRAIQISRRTGTLDIVIQNERTIEITANAVVVIAGDLLLPE